MNSQFEPMLFKGELLFLSGRKYYRTTFSQPREDGEFGEVHSLDYSITQKTKKAPAQKLIEDS